MQQTKYEKMSDKELERNLQQTMDQYYSHKRAMEVIHTLTIEVAELSVVIVELQNRYDEIIGDLCDLNLEFEIRKSAEVGQEVVRNIIRNRCKV
ncbi:hypothetical protein [Vibrio superstes]|uniref:Uncharacterized protein n=1 Tax=Vibrio superstes NBRC 103154 TaxID=1219062 RepID=A0A511QQF3_9VIBR|nr:hypothetical protein [Vibrio superstes]GEM79297.1 hypothetical protein VSU01S_15420 [Vibrio superstes NBRC 103154]